VVKFCVANGSVQYCCFSPDGRLVAVSAGYTAYVWDISSSIPHLAETLIGHTSLITSLVFSSPSSLISTSNDQLIKFWQIGTSSMDIVETDPKTIPFTSALIKSITLQAEDGIIITSDSNGMGRIWDISTGIRKASFRTPANASQYRDIRLIDGRIIIVWHTDREIRIWDIDKGELPQTVNTPGDQKELEDLKISADGSKIFCLYEKFIKVWSLWTGMAVTIVRVGIMGLQWSLTVDGSRVWVHCPQSEYQGWDFRISGSSPIPLPSRPTLYFSDTMVWDTRLSRIEDTVARQVIFQLSGRFLNPIDVQCGNYYLVAYYGSGELLILDFNHVFL